MRAHPCETCQRTASISAALLTMTVALSAAQRSLAAVTYTTQHGLSVSSLGPLISSTDLIQGKNSLDVDVFERFFDSFGNEAIGGWHSANSDPADQFAAFTDGAGMRPSNLTGLLADFPFEGSPAKIVEYLFDNPVDIGQINIFTGNRDPDGRIFSTTYIEYSTDNAATFQPLEYFQSDPSGTINNGSTPVPPLDPAQRSTLVSIFDDASATLLSGVTNLIFNLYAVDNTGGEMRDPFDALNMFTGLDDGLTAAFVSPKLLEIDVLPPPGGIVGDYNEDSVVNAADYVVWRANVGGSTLPNRDPGVSGPVGQNDYNVWRARYGNTSGLGSGARNFASVPEPTALAMIVGAAGLALGVRFRSVLRAAATRR